MTKFLLIAFKFPPYAGVGGFRWSKLCKYLAALGHQIHVVTVHWGEMGPHTFIDDVRHPNITIHRIPSGAPHRLKYLPIENRSLSFLRYGLLSLSERCWFYDDEAQRWGKHLIPCCEDLIAREGMSVVVATGHPFQANRWAAELKRRNPTLRLIQDFRDPWADNPFRVLSAGRAAQVRRWQVDAVESADCVVTVTKGLQRLYLEGTRQRNGKVIHNGFDPGDDLNQPTRKEHRESAFEFVHLGNVANGRDVPLRRFLEAVERVLDDIPDVRVTLVGKVPAAIPEAFPGLCKKGILRVQNHVGHAEAMAILARADYALQLNAEAFPYLVSTKVYEHGMLRVPTVSLNYGGEIEELIRTHGLGHSLHVERDDIEAFLRELHRNGPGELSYQTDRFHYRALAGEYSELIEQLAAGS